ncbi:M12 family metallo-peptidase [Paenibacillus glycanilyticus]|uniref:Peptidase M10 metallopeptidase domain-containing protein n=1 Tax=Paenibacillus glycanilyticus TaxID=126569 RepID=A0ABQ6G8X1_9BACL|nr:M12 family metallo-peptidase [Paenibacillus glycanilyticus]GLX67389.1 hypothetical protein MU1_17340 [Paenibacillus glycanilyticus]
MALPLLTVDVYALFTKNAKLGSSVAERQKRFQADLDNANRVWKTGFINNGSVQCNIQFVNAGIYNYSDTKTINSETIPYPPFPGDVNSLINQFRARSGIKKRAIFVVYVSGNKFKSGDIGLGGYQFIGSDYWGKVALTNLAADNINKFTFAHEAGHVFGLGHSGLSNNIMNAPVTSSSPLVTTSQCTTARKSKVIRGN